MSARVFGSSLKSSAVVLRDAKRTKVLATVGPATSSPAVLRRMIEAGANAFRINFSHGDSEQRETYLANIRAAEAELEQPVAVCADLCGPKIRVGMLQGGKVHLRAGQKITIQRTPIEGSEDRISTTLPELVDVVAPGHHILLADGRLRLEVTELALPEAFFCRVIVGGDLSNGKGVNLPHTKVNVSALTEKDRSDVEWIVKRNFDYVALSFVQRAEDVLQLRKLLDERDCPARIIAKIEKPQAIDHIEEIVAVADAVMVARGDLGVEMDFPAVPIAQKSIARHCQAAGKPCIVATEMLESMIHAPTPTRAEISDIANAVFDHADAVMLSAESSIGEYPVEAVTAMSRTVCAAEEYLEDHEISVQVAPSQPVTTAALAGAIRHIMTIQEIAAVAMYTDTGRTARLISKNRPACPILAMASNMATVRRCGLYYGVMARCVAAPQDAFQLLEISTKLSKELGVAKAGDRIIVVSGHPVGVEDQTNGLIIELVE